MDPLTEPVTLHDVLEKSTIAVTLDDRFEMAKAAASAIHAMHSAGWMHRNFSSKCILFFKSSLATQDGYDFRHPYLCGFEHSRPVNANGSNVQHLPWKLQDALHHHPSYMWHKYLVHFGNEPSNDKDNPEMKVQLQRLQQKIFKFRHDYYSLGMLLLQIGLWQPVESMALCAEPPEYFSPEFEGMESGQWLAVPMDKRMEEIRTSLLFGRIGLLLDDESADQALEMYKATTDYTKFLRTLRQAVEEENIGGLTIDSKNDHGTDLSFANCWDKWSQLYPLAVLRNDAIKLATDKLGVLMGRRYQEVVLRCLKSDFNVRFDADELRWLRGFNWLAVKELEKCCA